MVRGVDVVLPLRTVSEPNVRGHWAVKSQRARNQRWVARHLVSGAELPRPPLVVTLCRVSPRRLDDDNLRGALKHVRDGVADALGIDDGSDLVEWRYAQVAKIKSAEKFAVWVRIEGA